MSETLRERIASRGLDWIVPDWPVAARVRALATTRSGGASSGAFATLNLGAACGDEPRCVALNRAQVAAIAGCEPAWMRQVHGTAVVDVGRLAPGEEPQADAAVSSVPGRGAVVLLADCLPVLLAERSGRIVGAAHAGWRGLAAGVVEATLAAMRVDARDLVAWLGPAIGAADYEVGDEVRDAFCAGDAGAAGCFRPGRAGRWLADLPALAARRLRAAGVDDIHGGGRCTLREPDSFYSYRRDRTTGRMAAMIWLAE